MIYRIQTSKVMITLKHTIFIFGFLILSAFGYANTPDGITKNIETAIRAGSAENLAEFFNSNVQLKINDRQQVYSKRQAQAIMNDFFSRNEPVDYQASGSRTLANQRTVMGILKTNDFVYRFLYRVSDYNGEKVISYIEIEKLN